MKRSVLGFLFGVVVGLAFVGCAPTISLQTQGSAAVAVNKSALHYIVPPTATESAQTKSLYPLVVAAFRQNQIALTSSKKAATYVVTWGTEQKSVPVKSLQTVPGYYPYGGNLNVNSYDYGGVGIYGQPATGPQYVPVVSSYNMQHFTITVWKQGGPQPVEAWSGTGATGVQAAKDPAVIIDQIVAHYGTNFNGNAEIR
jgi:hypothetical protein